MTTNHTITLLPLGSTFQVESTAGATVLTAAEAAGINLPNSCRNGTCRTCLCRLASGTVRYLVEWPGLSIEEKREDYLLPCVAVPTSDLVVSAPLAKRRA
ncbi:MULTISPECIES: 2Fe-2S iron-sulfur cluster-binding protein [unclassified Massilia]|uniref:2Fe-2S iron-sulfur cluster-binding protein n=1 Tax=unclassified Massilia TaxID=2609279 RepID=UPI00177D1876|nr:MULTISPECIES: 2Fe-2S iron-sulfur cluster-binding protein [unclassified Massilia]MBD8532128.1 2Fe-2S iron-sulfur cluster binding domain-containing protein [Massilia sp. CFBP 13647]MBD8675614.1 2Fe-2S iron-sulfur cluster binding domain-containing protein [Massilia sp. CFBP 13721]